VLHHEGIGCIPFSPLAQGLLTDKYLNGIPEGSRAAKSWGFLKPEMVEPAIEKVKKLNEIAQKREQTLAQMALVWLLKDPRITSVLIGASSVEQLEDNVAALKNPKFTKDELKAIELILAESKNQGDAHPETEKLRSRIDFIKSIVNSENLTQTNPNAPESRSDYFKNVARNFKGQS
jgi:aryl-alcohol dehydrogenase-like predicted oxidoreductase